MNPSFLSALKSRLLADLEDLRLPLRLPPATPVVPADPVTPTETGGTKNGIPAEPDRAVQIHIGDLPPKKRCPGVQDKLDDAFPCLVLVPASGYAEGSEDVASVAVICGVYCPGEGEGDAEAAEMDLAVLLSRVRQSLFPCVKSPLDARYRLTEDAKGRLFPWEKSDLQPRPYMQATLMTHWRMKGLE